MNTVENAAPAKLRANVASWNTNRTYTVCRALSPSARRDAYELRHRCYLNGGYIDARPDGLLSDDYDLLPTSHTVVIYEHGTPIGSVRGSFLSIDDIDAVPAGAAYPDEVRRLLAPLPKYRGKPQAMEINRLVRSPAAENNQGLVFMLLRAAGCLALDADVQLLLSCVRQNHIPFYRRMGNDVASELKAYSGFKLSTQLLACPRVKYDEVRAAFPIMDPMAWSADPADTLHQFMSGNAVKMTLAPR